MHLWRDNWAHPPTLIACRAERYRTNERGILFRLSVMHLRKQVYWPDTFWISGYLNTGVLSIWWQSSGANFSSFRWTVSDTTQNSDDPQDGLQLFRECKAQRNVFERDGTTRWKEMALLKKKERDGREASGNLGLKLVAWCARMWHTKKIIIIIRMSHINHSW